MSGDIAKIPKLDDIKTHCKAKSQQTSKQLKTPRKFVFSVERQITFLHSIIIKVLSVIILVIKWVI